MRMKNIVFAIAFLIILFSLHDAMPEEIKYSFEIYFVESDIKATKDINLSKLKISKEPWINHYDIMEYLWDDHIFLLNSERARLPITSLHGKPFVVVVDGVRCYVGFFWSPIFSVSCPYPVIEIEIPPSEYQIKRAYPTPKFAVGDDSRNDARIYNCLKKLDLLKNGNS